jgi:acyl carrier protein
VAQFLEKPMSKVEEKILEIIKKTKGVKDVSRASTWEELGVDSLDVAEFFMEVENQLGVTIPDSDATNLKTVGEVIDYVEKHQKKE